MEQVDVVVVGGGPAGLSAALVLGRCLRAVRVYDLGRPRNAASRHVGGFLSRDGADPHALRAEAVRQLARYATVEVRHDEVVDVDVETPGRAFVLRTRAGDRVRARRLLLATGIMDILPPVDGLIDFYGVTVHHCPYCEGWEVRGARLAALGRGANGLDLALGLRVYSDDVTLLTHGPSGLDADARARLERNGVRLDERPLARADGVAEAKKLERIVFADGAVEPFGALFFTWGNSHASEFASLLGCVFDDDGYVAVDDSCAAAIPGVYVAGDAARSVNLVAAAVGRGAQAAYAINVSLVDEERP